MPLAAPPLTYLRCEQPGCGRVIGVKEEGATGVVRLPCKRCGHITRVKLG